MRDPIELPNAGWVTLSEAAARLGVSPRTALRWVHEGKLHGELRRGAHGPQYYVPTHQVEAVAVETMLEARAREATTEGASGDLAEVSLIGDGTLIKVLEELRADILEAVEGQEAREAALREELNQIRAELAAGIEALKLARVVEEPVPPPRPWWKLW